MAGPALAMAGEVLRLAVNGLRAAGIDDARLEAEVLLAHVLGRSRAQLLAHPEWILDAGQSRRFRRLVALRAERWPLPYLTGWREFYGRPFRVNRGVLIPRPETELLVETAIRDAAKRSPTGDGITLVDVGTGSGILAITLARHLPGATVIATDISLHALAVAKYNAARHAVAGRIGWVSGDLLEELSGRADLVVANLPYIPTGDLAGLPPEVSHEPRLALDGGPDGLDAVRRLLDQLPLVLKPGGSAFLEIGAWQGPAARALAETHCAAARVAVLKDYAGLDRILSLTDYLCTSS